MQKIPGFDLRDFLSDDPVRKQQFVEEIGNAFTEIGFVTLKGHFLDDDLVDEFQTEIKNFFSLPVETKVKYEKPVAGGIRGYVSFGKERLKGKADGGAEDLKEFWHIGQWVSEDSRWAGKYPNNVNVEELPNFNKVSREAFRSFEKTGMYVLRALALYLKVDEFYFDGFVKEGNSTVRMNHYPPITEEPENGAVRASEHSDISFITLLLGAVSPGLQIRNVQGKWIDVVAEPDELIVNIGDMLSRLSNNKLKSTKHRVINPPRELWHTSRYSMPFLMHAVRDANLSCLESCIDEDHPKLYEDIMVDELLMECLLSLGVVME